MAKIKAEISVKQRYWCAAMIAIGAFTIDLGADPNKIAGWIVKYGMKLEIKEVA